MQQMTPTAWAQGAENALICAIAAMILWCAIAAAVSLISGKPFSDSFRAALEVLWGFTFLVFLGTWLYGRANAGRVLIDCGPYPMRGLFLILAGAFLILGVMDQAAASVSKTFASPGLGGCIRTVHEPERTGVMPHSRCVTAHPKSTILLHAPKSC